MGFADTGAFGREIRLPNLDSFARGDARSAEMNKAWGASFLNAFHTVLGLGLRFGSKHLG